MKYRALKVEGAFAFEPDVFPDERGRFTAPFQESVFTAAVGHPFPAVGQANCSTSRRDVLRGVHYTRTPPGTAKYVYCAHGKALDIMVDLRVGSPTFMAWDAVTLDADHPGAVYFPLGVGHAFLSLRDGTAMCYMLSGEYVGGDEYAVSALDPALGLPLGDTRGLVVSARDREARTASEAHALGLLPRYQDCVEIERGFGRAARLP
ncbi:dTDP-4-dehydrorhamnose 3,5-epimerase family protein [Streptomyces caniscabiei]|uniref:dTDP-4-dehydrorhamnose 3,5-epimerase family protein n=1 Tax=Streptomyces caniscabiei TaxID=2746961 RepID=UPI0029B9B4CC|nr:dTDP-4-dehydrorhamnose 3,5-epimerase family protein [Streptomyces caniscabiei]MDX2600829.1 dTDP-4-dehydrorhamnose 3,5-epimerase family protein [Streptomyces caniscabiei]MDX2741431.1 dTDP-4-dehydrorhamnose 3,5-epimerase family protein [Streptomyces caniscabiei]MDX2781353.1 dTDP-4-dehydrorhamnose 3,5-epimerase family protein [Streptomyces caniscabiei]